MSEQFDEVFEDEIYCVDDCGGYCLYGDEGFYNAVDNYLDVFDKKHKVKIFCRPGKIVIERIEK